MVGDVSDGQPQARRYNPFLSFTHICSCLSFHPEQRHQSAPRHAQSARRTLFSPN
jgi:hypothetical protein